MEERVAEIGAALVVSGFDDPDVITATLMLRPSRVVRKGDKVHPKINNVHTDNHWVLDGPIQVGNDLAVAVDALLELVEPQRSRFLSLPNNVSKQVSCVVYTRTSVAMMFSCETLQKLGELGASLDIDYYCLPQDSKT